MKIKFERGKDLKINPYTQKRLNRIKRKKMTESFFRFIESDLFGIFIIVVFVFIAFCSIVFK